VEEEASGEGSDGVGCVMGWKLDGWSLVMAFVAGFFFAAVVDDWFIARHGGLAR
jgi:hypothetical protein